MPKWCRRLSISGPHNLPAGFSQRREGVVRDRLSNAVLFELRFVTACQNHQFMTGLDKFIAEVASHVAVTGNSNTHDGLHKWRRECDSDVSHRGTELSANAETYLRELEDRENIYTTSGRPTEVSHAPRSKHQS